MALDQYFTTAGQPVSDPTLQINWATNPDLRRQAIDESISWLDWREASFLKYCGLNNESKFNFDNWPARQFRWLHDRSNPRNFTLSAAIDNSVTAVPVPADVIQFISRGDILIFEQGVANEEWAVVTATPATGSATGFVTVSRDFLATSTDVDLESTFKAGATVAPPTGSPGDIYGPKAHAISTTVEISTTARGEGWKHDIRGQTSPKSQYNVRQILQSGVQVSRSQELYKDYGVTDPYSYYLSKLIGGNQVGGLYTSGDLAFKLLSIHRNGVRFRSPNVASQGDIAGGYEYFLRQHWVDNPDHLSLGSVAYNDATVMPNVIDMGGKPLTRQVLEKLFISLFEDGSSARTLCCNSWTVAEISSWYEGLVRTDRDEKGGGSVISTVRTVHGDIDLMWDRWMPKGRLELFDKEMLGICTQDPFVQKEMPSDYDGRATALVGEYSYALKEPNHHGLIYNFDQRY